MNVCQVPNSEKFRDERAPAGPGPGKFSPGLPGTLNLLEISVKSSYFSFLAR